MVIASSSSSFFEDAAVPPHGGSTEFSLQRWESLRAEAIAPRFHSGYSDNVENRRDFLHGAALLGYHMPAGDEWRVGHVTADPTAARIDYIKPQQLAIVDTLGLGKSENVVEIPRRASKTTTLFMLLLGRCARRPSYLVTFSAQSGVKSLARLREWKTRLDRINPDPEASLPPWLRTGARRQSAAAARHVALFGDDILPDEAQAPVGRKFNVLLGASNMRIEFSNASAFIVLKPDAEAFRSEAGDVVWLDEAQELDPIDGADLMAGVLPLMDTRPGAQLIVSGTTGKAQVGPFWDALDAGRSDPEGTGIIDYAIDPDTEWADIEDEPTAMQLVAGTHPGVGTLTTLDIMRERYRKLPRPQFAAEYLSLWPKTKGARIIAPELWAAGLRKRRPAKPERVAFGMDIRPGGAVAAICSAWRDEKGRAFIELIYHQPGTGWIPRTTQHLSRTYRGSSTAYDDIAEGKATATECELLTPRPRLQVQTFTETAAGCVQLMRDLTRKRLLHFAQPGLDSAIEHAARREVKNDRGIWLWTADDKEADITPLVAATRALRNWDQHYARRKTYRPNDEEAAA